VLDLKTIPANLDDLRMRGRSIRSYKGAAGAGMFEPLETTLAGGLDAVIPLYNAEHVRALWDAGGRGKKDDPKSGWNHIEKYEKFSLGLIAFKLRPRFFSEPHWLTRYSFWFQMNAFLDLNTVQIDGVGFSKTRTIPEVFLLVDKLFRAEWPLLSFEEAMRK
jgi:hypothetical protein